VIGVSDFERIETNLGSDTWIPEIIDFSSDGHAMSIVSYDDNKNGGSFELMNSWGNDWGKSGYCWVRYADLEKLIRRAYALTSMNGNNKKSEFYNFKLNIKLIGDNSRSFLFESEPKDSSRVIYQDEFYLGPIDNSNFNFIHPKEINKYQIALNSESDVYYYLLSKSSKSNINLDFPLNSLDNNFLGNQNSGIVLPKEARNYFNIENLESGLFEDPQFLLLFSKTKIDMETVVKSYKNKKYENLNSFVKDVFQDNIVLSDLKFKENNDLFSDENNSMDFTLSNDINYILPIIINLKTKSIEEEEIIDEGIIEKPKKKNNNK
jgi:hypothetical protein